MSRKRKQYRAVGWWLAAFIVLLNSRAEARSFELPADHLHVIGEVQTLIADANDTFTSIAQKHGVGFDALSAANPLVNPWYPGEGTELKLPTQYVLPDTARKGIVINVAELRLYYYPPNEDKVYVYPVGIGRAGWETPLAETTVTRIDHNPVWRPPESIKQEYRIAGLSLPDVVAAGPDNPLGKAAIRLALPGYLLHGTNKPEGVGMRVSHGCIRLYPEHISELAAMVDAGTRVSIVNQPVKWGRSVSGIVVEAHRERLPHQSVVARSKLVERSETLAAWLQEQRSSQKLFTGIPLLYSPRACANCKVH